MSAPMDVPSVPDPGPEPVETFTEPTPQPVPEAAKSWIDNLDADLRQAPTLGKFKNVGDLAKSYIELQTKMGQKGLIHPKEDAPADEWSKFYSDLGRPENADGYDLGEWTPPENVSWDETFQKDALAWMHESGLNSKQVQTILSKYAERVSGEAKTMAENARAVAEEYEKTRRQKWGMAHDQKLDLAKRAFDTLIPEDAREMISSAMLENGGMLGDHPAFLEMMAQMGQRLAEHQLLGDKEPSRWSRTPEEAEAEFKRAMYDPEFRAAYSDPRHKDHADALAKVQKWSEQIEGGSRPAENALVSG